MLRARGVPAALGELRHWTHGQTVIDELDPGDTATRQELEGGYEVGLGRINVPDDDDLRFSIYEPDPRTGFALGLEVRYPSGALLRVCWGEIGHTEQAEEER